MSGPFGSSQWMYSSGGFYPYEIEQSLRFNDDDSAYLSRTPASATSTTTWTWSGWVKRGNIGIGQMFFGCTISEGNNYTVVNFTSGNVLGITHVFGGVVQYFIQTSAVFRDPSAWYHIVAVADTNNATQADRLRLYVNGVRQAIGSTTPASLGQGSFINSTNAHAIGRYGTSQYFDGYMAEVNFIDGSALDPTSFGEFKSDIWVPKAYSGSYGTNGFYLSFADSANIGDDLSGNTNDWTANNLVSTDVLLDSPTNNFAVLNALLDDRSGGEVHSEGNLKWTNTSGASAACATGTFLASGKIYFEAYLNTVGAEANIGFGRADETNSLLSPGGSANDGTFVYNCQAGTFYNGASSDTGPSAVSAGSVVSVAYDQATGKTWFAVDGTWYNSGDPAAGTNASFTISSSFIDKLVPLVGGYNNATWVANFGQDSSFAGNKTAQGNTDDNGQGDFYYAPPSGYLALNTANLPAPAIDPAEDDVPADYFNTVLYTGTGAAQSITGVGFQPDFIWIKNRSAGSNHYLYDVIRGAGFGLYSDLTSAEVFEANQLTSIDTDGFSVSTGGATNGNTNALVAWNWLAGNGTSSNTDGTITSTVSVNQKAGFSIVGYTGTGANATVGHGLGVEPSVVIVKARGTPNGLARSWFVYTKSAGPTKTLYLNETTAAATTSGPWNDTAPTSSVFSLGNEPSVNWASNAYIAYCFAEVEGFSKFGSYTGNGSTDGPFVFCGFRPAFVLLKRTNSTGAWDMHDAARDPANVVDQMLEAQNSNAEVALAAYSLDFLANGFKLRGSGASQNASGGNFIFAAFAESPFKYSNAR